ncbi:bifunctional folylpolyglutamate synthase/dihydrofolate synthase [Kitasatospora sp. NPDC048239]|uniref:bifunctional folylpolyglutamate synthase/dihydrofolate synthase n=1 Tax=Kitasatospora sp. NPDC048239 TaxID=3364046 RepID=UPI003718D880
MLNPDAGDAVSPQDLYDAVLASSRPRHWDEEFDLERVRRLMAVLGDPHRGLPVVHVGGTAGKGSTARMIAEMLQAGGYRVGLSTKPHLRSLTERFLVDGRAIGAGELMDRARALGRLVDGIGPTWFESVSALALRYFADAEVDVAVVEVGMGGTTDATNVVEPLVSVVTNVGDDHVDMLGGSLLTVAGHKAGIIKPGAVAVSGVTRPELAEVIRARAAETGSPLLELGRDFTAEIESVDTEGTGWRLSGAGGDRSGLRLRARGRHQVSNAALAVTAVEALGSRGLPVAEAHWRKALAEVTVPGRLETVRRAPEVVLDGAHCPPKLEALAQALGEVYAGRRRIGVLALAPGRDGERSLGLVADAFDVVVATGYQAHTEFGAISGRSTGEIADILGRLRPDLPVHQAADPWDAYRLALSLAGEHDLICVTGSFNLVGAVRNRLLAD